MPTTTDMGFVHACAFCGWRRDSATAVVLPAGCPECGGSVDSRPGRAGDDALDPLLAVDAASSSRAAQVVLLLFAGALIFAAVRLGAHLGGAPGVITAVGAAGYLLLPFVPERLGPGPGR